MSQNSAQGTSICRAYTHKHISTKVLFISISCLFLFSIFPFLSSKILFHVCLCCTNILWKKEKVSAATRFCCSHFFNLKAHKTTKEFSSIFFWLDTKARGRKKKFKRFMARNGNYTFNSLNGNFTKYFNLIYLMLNLFRNSHKKYQKSFKSWWIFKETGGCCKSQF